MFSTYMFMVLLNLWWPSGDKIDIKFSITVQRIRKATVGILNCKWVNADLFFHSGLQQKYGATFQHPRLNIYTNILNLGNKQGAVSSKKLIYADNFIKTRVTP